MKRTFIAWQLLRKNLSRASAAVAGIAFANLLIFMQLGFQAALLGSNSKAQNSLDTDLVVIQSQLETFFSPRQFAREKLTQCDAHPGILQTARLYVGAGQWRNLDRSGSRQLLIFGTDPDCPAFRQEIVQAPWSLLYPLGRVFFDRQAAKPFGPVPQLLLEKSSLEAQVSGVRLQVVGLFRLGVSFAADGSIICSSETFHRIFSGRNPDKIDVGLIRLRTGWEPLRVAKDLQRQLGPEVLVLTKQQFEERERAYWGNGSSIGFIFGLGVAVGMVVGAVVVFQILTSDVLDHLPEYAMLKAMGYSDGFFLGVLAQESLILALAGFFPALGLTLWLYAKSAAATGLPVVMTAGRVLFVLSSTLVISLVSGWLASRRLRTADPADIIF